MVCYGGKSFRSVNGITMFLEIQAETIQTENDGTSDESVLYLHPTTMDSLSITRCGYVYVSGPNGPIILKCFPCDTLGTEDAAVHSSIYKYYTNSSASVLPLKSRIEAAKEVYLYPDKFRSFMASRDFQSYLTKKMRSLYLREDLHLNIDYLGYICNFTIKHISPLSISTCKTNSVDGSPSKNIPVDIDHENVAFDSSSTSTPILASKVSSESSKTKKELESKFYFLHPSSRVVVQQNELEPYVSFKEMLAIGEVIQFIKSSITSVVHSVGDSFNIFPKGIILIGPSGSGKSMIGMALKKEYDIQVFIIKCRNMLSTENTNYRWLERTLDKASVCSASVVFFDDLDSIFSYNKNSNPEDDPVLRKITHCILKFMNNTPNTLVIASVQNKTLLPSSLRKNGFLEKEIHLIPTSVGRQEILVKLLGENDSLLTDAEMKEIVDDTKGFCYGELHALCEKAKKSLCQSTNCSFTFTDLKKNVKQMKTNVPFNFESPNVHWSDIGGMGEVREALTEMISWPLTLSSQFKRFRITPSRGILLYGPPGCCKTMIAKALATEGDFHFVSVKASELFNKYVGESEQSVSELFKRARASAPCLLFFDEIDSLTPTRKNSSNVSERVLTQLLTEIDGVEPLAGVCILAATNRPEIIDPSFLRPGRFDRSIYVPLPDKNTRLDIFKVKLKNMPLSPDVDADCMEEMADMTERYSGAELSKMCEEAVKYAIKEDLTSTLLCRKHLVKALQEVHPKTSEDMIRSLKEFERKRNSFTSFNS